MIKDWISKCHKINTPVDIKTRGGYNIEQILDNKNCSKKERFWFNILGTDRYLFKSTTAESWEFWDPEIINPVRNTNVIYLKFKNVKDFSTAANYFREYKLYSHTIRDSIAYNKFWEKEEYKCLNGIESNGVYITGRHYFTINFGLFKAFPIDKHGNKISKSKKLTLLKFLDHQYYLFHEIDECKLNGKYSNNKDYLKWFPLKESIDFDTLSYIFHASSKARRKGFSAVVSIGVNVYDFVFLENSKSIVGAGQKSHYKMFQKGILETRNAIDKNTPWRRVTKILNRKDHFISGIITEDEYGTPITEGYKSEIEFLSFKDGGFGSIGDSVEVAVLEEPGKFDHLIETIQVSVEPVLREGNDYIGFCILGGTSGDMETGGSQDLAEIMYKPKGYGFKEYDNIYEETEVNGTSGYFIDDLWFFSATTTKKELLELDKSKRLVTLLANYKYDKIEVVDKYGNSYRYFANLLLTKKRNEKRKISSQAYQKFITQQPKYLSEAFLINESSPFDTALAQRALGELRIKQTQDSSESGYFNVSGYGKQQTIDWVYDFKALVINEYPWKGESKQGSWVIYEHPVFERPDIQQGDNPENSKSAKVNNWRYIAGVDPIDFGSEESAVGDKNHSMAATFIVDTLTRNIVAEYVSRPYKSDDYFEQLWRGIEYFNATLLYENNLKGLFSYFRSKNKLYLLSNDPESLKDKWGYKSQSNVKGFHATKSINNYAREMIHKWSTELVPINQDDVSGEMQYLERMYFIRSFALLQEIISWNSKSNFDRISGFGAAMILLFDKDYNEVSKSEKVSKKLNSGIFKKFKDKLNRR